MIYNTPNYISLIVENFYFLLDMGYDPKTIHYGMRAYPSMSFCKQLGEFKRQELWITGSDYGTENTMPPFNVYLCNYYKIFGQKIRFRTVGINEGYVIKELSDTTVEDYLYFICNTIKNNSSLMKILDEGF